MEERLLIIEECIPWIPSTCKRISYYLLTKFAFRAVRYLDQGPEVRTDLVRTEVLISYSTKRKLG